MPRSPEPFERPFPTAFTEPTRPVRALWVAGVSLAVPGMWMAFFGPLRVLLPEQVGRIVPDDKETVLAWVTGVGATVV